MRYIKPKYYDQFCCTADKCPDTCCAGWQIMIDEDSLEKYGKVKGAFGKRLRNSIDWTEGAFYQYDRRCTFLNEDNLCDLYTALGGDSLCDTCRKYPRHVEEYDGLREWSLSLSCPVAAEIILSQQGFPEFLTTEDDAPDELEEEFEDFDFMLFTQLEDARNAVFDVLRGLFSGKTGREECINLHEIMRQALDLAKDMQECVEDGRYFEIEEVVRQYCETAKMGKTAVAGKTANAGEAVKAGKASMAGGKEDHAALYDINKKLYREMYSLERLREEWTGILEDTYNTLYRDGAEKYGMIRNEFEAYLQQYPEKRALWENAGLQLFVFFVYTYFCGAVYDDWIYSKMALSVYSVEFIRELLIAGWKRKGTLEFEDCLELSYRYAREIEHSDQNLNALEEYFYR